MVEVKKLDGRITDKESGKDLIWKIWLVMMIIFWKIIVLLLADVFEKFTSESLKFYKLDPSYYFSSPELSWDAMLKMTE